ncbi:FUSC family protein [Streptomyces sioyaensis]|uniref:FUSC family protein n=1 Tax=Streptomyces sioyaensis TaxID=67364 RepID=UPI001F1D9D2A|nr:FUSC family protein [Streptomyces sioyaensis]MCF3178148.1 FUSC family protein [Streptomyces sioyaensis]
MGKHSKPSGQSGRTEPASGVRVRPLPVRSAVRLGRPSDIWHKSALSAVVAMAVPALTLFALGRLDLIFYTAAGSLCALYGHGLPYAARARMLLWVVLGMASSVGIALTTASLTTSAELLVVCASLIAAVHKTVFDAARLGPPGNIILTFITASAFFVPQHLGQVPLHVALTLGTGVLAWLVCMAPALLRPQGPERIVVARALDAAAGLLRTEPRADGVRPAGVSDAWHATSAAVHAAWRTLYLVPTPTPAKATARAGLERLLMRAESVLGSMGQEAEEADRLRAWARGLRGGGPLPGVMLSAEQDVEVLGVTGEVSDVRRPAPCHPRGVRPVLARLAPGSPLLPIGARVAAGCVLAGWVSMALGVGHPYWAVVTAASIYQANTTLTWQRALQRTLGSLLGLLLYTALLPLIHVGHLAMIALALACMLGAEAWISRNYWLGSVCITPLALLLAGFGSQLPARVLIADRWIDTVVGAVVGLACCVAVTNRRAADRIEVALERVAAAEAAASRLLAAGPVSGAEGAREVGWARDRLAGCLAELREAVEVASGEWWQRALPDERIDHAQQQGHRALALLVRQVSMPAAVV